MRQDRFVPLKEIRLGAVQPQAAAGRSPRRGLVAVLQAWSAVVRPPLSQRAAPSGWRDGVLTLTVADPGWRANLEKLASALRTEMNSWLGGEVVEEIRVRGAGAGGG